MTTETRSLYSQLPAIDRLLRDSSFLSLRDTYGHTRVVELLRQMLDEAREVIRGSQTLPAWCENWAQEVDARLTKEAQSALRPVINLTGTVLHTNLGRALQAEAAVEAVAQAVACAMFGPLALYLMATLPAAMLEIIFGMKREDTFLVPPFSIASCSAHSVLKPPMPEPM